MKVFAKDEAVEFRAPGCWIKGTIISGPHAKPEDSTIIKSRFYKIQLGSAVVHIQTKFIQTVTA